MVRYIFSSFIKQNQMYKTLIILMVIIIVFSVFTINSWNETEYRNTKKCYEIDHIEERADITFLKDIMEADRKPQLGRSIFFHETSCANGLVKLTSRQACAIESAAKLNPNWEVYLLFASPVGFLNTSDIDPIIAALELYPNIYMRSVNLWTYARNTPMEKWLNSKQLFYSKYFNSHTSDFLRYLSLYKWGGTYLDLDVIVKRSLNDIPPNYAGAESTEFVAAGVMNFDYKGIGHDIAKFCLREFERTYDGSDWGNNGPGVITRVLHEVCHTTMPSLMTRSRCKGFNVFPINAFYAVSWRNWNYFFENQYVDRTMRMINDSIAIHVWNKHSWKRPVHVGSKVAYGLLAEKYCPEVYRSCGDVF